MSVHPVRIGGLAVLAGTLVHAAPALAAHAPVLGDALGIVRRLDDPCAVALTFDDGPHPVATPRVLELLAGWDAVATFFLVGEQIRRHPGLAAEIASAGHAIGLHGDTHRSELRLGIRALAGDRARGLAAIHEATGILPIIHRPPYGAASGAGLALARRSGMRTVLWSRWGRDWRRRATPVGVAADVLRGGPLGGEIVLLHDADHYGAAGSWQATIGALPQILATCAHAGLHTIGL